MKTSVTSWISLFDWPHTLCSLSTKSSDSKSYLRDSYGKEGDGGGGGGGGEEREKLN